MTMPRAVRPRTLKALTAAAALATLPALPAAPVLATGLGPGNGEIGFDVGGTKFDSNTAQNDGGRFVFRGGYHFTRLFQIEGEIGASRVSNSGVETTLATAFVNGVFNFQTARPAIRPYVLAGVGRARLMYDFGGGFTQSDTASAYHGAAGCRFFVGERRRLGLRVEVSAIREETFGTTGTHKNLTGGLTWALGRGR